MTAASLPLQRLVLGLTCGFFLTLMTVPKVPGPLGALLTLCGVYVLVRHGGLDRDERAYALVMAILPGFYLASMLIHDWDPRLFVRPMRLVWSIPIFLLLHRVRVDARLVLGSLAIGLLSSLPAAAYQRFVLGEERVFGIYSGGDYGNFAAVYAGVAAVGLVLGLRRPQREAATILTAAAVVLAGTVISLWSGSRTSWIVLALGVLAAALVALRKPVRAASVYPVLLIVLVAAGLSATDLTMQRLHRIVEEATGYVDPAQRQASRTTSVGLRLESLRFGLSVVEKSPFLGVGTVEYRKLAREAAERGEIAPQIPEFGLLHNLFIDHLVIGGVFGLGALLAFWIALFCVHVRWLRQAKSDVTRFFCLGLMVISSSYFVIGLLGSMFGSSLGTHTIAMLWATFSAYAIERRPA